MAEHPLDIADERTREQIAGGETIGVGTTDWEKDEEEADEAAQQGNIAALRQRTFPLSNSEPSKRRRSKGPVDERYQKSRVLGRGGGIGARDIRETGGLNVDPELIVLGPYIPEKDREKRTGPNPDWVRSIDLGKVGYDSALYSKLVPLTHIWSGSQTEVTYKKGTKPEEDKIEFNNFEQNINVTLTIPELAEALKRSDISLNFHRPEDNSDRRFMSDLKHIQLGAGVVEAHRVRIEVPPKEKKEKIEQVFNVKLNQRALDRITLDEKGNPVNKGAELLRGEIKDFMGLLTHAGEGEIVKAGFGTDGIGGLTSFALVDKDGTRYTIPIMIARMVFEGMTPVVINGKAVGVEFKVPGGKREIITGRSRWEDAKSVMENTRFNDVKLKPGVKFFVGNSEEQ